MQLQISISLAEANQFPCGLTVVRLSGLRTGPYGVRNHPFSRNLLGSQWHAMPFTTGAHYAKHCDAPLEQGWVVSLLIYHSANVRLGFVCGNQTFHQRKGSS